MAAATRKSTRWRQRGLLLLLAGGFAVSGLLRLGAIDFAFAASGDEAAPATNAGYMPSTPITAPLDDALALIEGRAEALDARELALDGREQALAAAQEMVESRLARLEAAEVRLRDLIEMSDTAAEADLARLTTVYETMRPEEAAAVFGQMEPSFAAGFLSRMRPDAGAALLAELPPETAYSISVLLATRNSAAPRLDAVEADTE